MFKKSLCVVPYYQAFIRPDGQYRDCCSTSPHTIKFEENFTDWWNGNAMSSLRNSLQSDILPNQCKRCSQSESIGSSSMRTIVAAASKNADIKPTLPNRYQLAFGNICNLGCWTCEENLSSVIQEEKKKLKILPIDFVDPSIMFAKAWPSLQETILKSYEEHDEILINIWGGEPTISKDFVEFLELLVKKGLSSRTKIEMFSNCHSPKDGFQELLKNNEWAHITILASMDAVGEAGNWIRYGSNWDKVYNNFLQFKDIADYIEIQCTLSVISARHLPELSQFAVNHSVPLTHIPLQDPWYMNVSNWDGDMGILGSELEYQKYGLDTTWKLFSSTPIIGASQSLKNYINQFSNRTNDVATFNPNLHKLINS